MTRPLLGCALAVLASLALWGGIWLLLGWRGVAWAVIGAGVVFAGLVALLGWADFEGRR